MSTLITMKNDMEEGVELREMLSLNDAIKLLNVKKTETCKEALPIFSKVNHAHNYLCEQLKVLMGE